MIIAICGYSGHGKDTVANYLACQTVLRYTCSTSEWAAERIVFPVLSGKYGYPNAEACWDDRRNKKNEWAELIWAYNNASRTGVKLYQEMIPDNDIINGIFSAAEYLLCRQLKLIDKAIWVNADSRLPVPQQQQSLIGPDFCDFHIDNNGTEFDVKRQIDKLIRNNFHELAKSNISAIRRL